MRTTGGTEDAHVYATPDETYDTIPNATSGQPDTEYYSSEGYLEPGSRQQVSGSDYTDNPAAN